MNRLTGSRVDFDKRIIYGIVVMTVGKAFGHCSVDATTLDQFAAVVGGEKVRGRENHPDEGITKTVADLRGYFFNFRIEGEKLLADFQAYSEAAAGKEPTKLLHKAAEAPEIFGVSPVFFGVPEKNMARVSKVVAIDFVDIPAGDDANQQLFHGVSKMKFSIEEKDGKFSVTCDQDGPAKKGEAYEAEFPAHVEKQKAAMAAEEEEKKKAALAADEEEKKKKAEMAASESDAGATQKDLTKAGAKAYSATDLENAVAEGRKQAIKYAADFDGVMDACGLKGDERDAFRKAHFAAGEKFGVEYVKAIGCEAMKYRAKAVGGGSGGDDVSSPEEVAAIERFHAHEDLRRGWFDEKNLSKLNAKDSPEYKSVLNAFILQRRKTAK